MKKDYTDYSYRDILNVKLDKGILRSTIKLMLKPMEGNQGKNQEEQLDLDNLPNDLAEKGYGIIRENIGKFQTPFSTGYATTPNAKIILRPRLARKNVFWKYFFYNLDFMYDTQVPASSNR